MIDMGFEQEVIKLKSRGDLHQDLPSIRCVGYRQMWQHLEGEFDHDEMIFRGVVATRQLAKRQMTWLRKMGNGRAFHPSDLEEIEAYLEEIINK